MFSMVNKFNEALHVQLEDDTEVAKITRSAHLPESRIVDYARHRVAEFDEREKEGREHP
jgi:translation initiation factor IF-3